jgi:hypothetical protein
VCGRDGRGLGPAVVQSKCKGHSIIRLLLVWIATLHAPAQKTAPASPARCASVRLSPAWPATLQQVRCKPEINYLERFWKDSSAPLVPSFSLSFTAPALVPLTSHTTHLPPPASP